MKKKRTGVRDSSHLRRWIAPALAAFPCLGENACAQNDGPDSAPHVGLVTTLPRLDALPGTTVLLPVVPGGARLDALLGPPDRWIPERTPTVTIAGRTLHAALFRLDGSQRDERGGESWLPVALEWRSTPLEDGESAPRGDEASFWVLGVDLPEQPIARHLQIGARRLPINWLDPVPERSDFARMPLLEAPLAARRALGDLLRSEARDPFRRWRCSLVADRFSAHSLWGEKPALVPFDDPVLEAAARHTEMRARAAIDVARRLDPDLGARLLSALTGVVRMPGGELLPAWPPDDASVLELLSELLDPGRSGSKKRADLEVWLSRAPAAAAWVVSDHAGGGVGGAGVRSVLVGIANLSDRQVICSCAPEGQAATNAEVLLPHRAALLRTAVDARGGGLRTRVVARAGTRSYPLSVVAVLPAAAPPGIDLGPLLPDWSMATWLGGRPPTVDAVRAASARLYAEPLRGGDGSRRWRIALEARTARGAPGEGVDRVMIWCGRSPDGAGVITLESSGVGVIDTGHGTEPVRAAFTRTEGGWLANVELPGWLTEGRGVMEFGVVRVDPSGSRSAWPRPMMPGQVEPARLAIDLSAWMRLEGP